MNTSAKPNIKYIVHYGVWVIFTGLLIFLLWAHVTTLESAAIAPGSVTVAGSRRVVQHLEGGIISAIFVQDGSHVNKNDLLAELDNTQAKAASQINQNGYWELVGTQSRIEAELYSKKLTFPKELASSNLQELRAIMALQAKLLESNQQNFNSSIGIYEQRIEQLQQEIAGTKAVIIANQEQLGYIEKELKDATILAAKRLIKQSQLFALQREFANISGKQGELKAKVAELEQKIGETKLQMLSLRDKRHKELLDELHETQIKLNDVKQRQKASHDILARTNIRAPIAGTVVNLKIHTVGGVIRPGEAIMDIVPNHEALIIDAKLNPLDIDVVHPGLVAKVLFTGLSQRNTPRLMGKVIHVSADALPDPQTNKPYFEVKIKIPHSELKKLVHQSLYPGMPAEVMIITRKTSPWDYMTKPLYKSFDRAFRED